MALINDAVLTNAPGCQPHTQSHRQRAASPTPRAALARPMWWMWPLSLLDRAVAFLVPLSATPPLKLRCPRLSPQLTSLTSGRSRPLRRHARWQPTRRRTSPRCRTRAHRATSAATCMARRGALGCEHSELKFFFAFVPFYKEEVHQGDSLNALHDAPSGLLHAGSVFLPTAGGYATAAASRWLGTG